MLIQGSVQLWCLNRIWWGWNPSPVQSQPWPGPEKNNPHNLVPGESGLMIKPYQWTQDKCGKQTTNLSADQVWVNSSIWYPITTPESPRFNTHFRFRVDCVIRMEPNLEKKTPPHHVGKAEGLGDSLPSPQSCHVHTIYDWMAGEQQTKQHKAPSYSM